MGLAILYQVVYYICITCLLISSGHADDGPVSNVRAPPSCLTSSASDGQCQWSSDRIAVYTYTACTKRVALTCWTWTPYLSLYKFCPGIGKDDCKGKCPEDNSLKRAMYERWVHDTCLGNGNWPDLPTGDLLNIPSDAAILATDLSIEFPSCIKNDDLKSDFDSASVSTSEVRAWLSDDSRTSTSKAYLFDQTTLCDDLVPADVLSNACGNSSSIEYTRALIWMHTYCGTYKDFEKQRMPSNWQDKAPVYKDNGTYLKLDYVTGTWNATEADSFADTDMKNHINSCPSTSLCNNLDSCDTLVPVIRKDCFCSNLGTCASPDLGWCVRNFTAQLTLKQYFDKVCQVAQTPLQSDYLLKWNETTHASPVNDTTGLAIDLTAECPSSRAKLTAFGLANVFVLLLVAGLGRRTLINKITCSRLSQADRQLWYVTGVAGVGFHLASNAINAMIVQKTPGYENTSFGHLFYLWCTRPRAAWMITALVCFQNGKAMYHSVTVSSLITEGIMQIVGSGLMGMVVDYCRRSGFFKHAILQYWPDFEHDTKLMYAGSLLNLAILFFCLVAIVWSVSGLRRRQQEMPNYLPCIESAAEGLDQNAVHQLAEVRHIVATLDSARISQQSRTSTLTHQPVNIAPQYQYLQDQCHALLTHWQDLQSSVQSGPKELRRERRARVAELRTRVNRRGEHNESESQFLGNPARQVSETKAKAQMARRELTNCHQSHVTILGQIDNTTADIQRLSSREQDLYARISRLSMINRPGHTSQLATQNETSNNRPGNPSPDGDSYDDPLGQEEVSLDILHAEYRHLAPRIAALNESKLRYIRLEPLYRDIGASWTELARCYDQLTEEWTQVFKQRRAETSGDRPGWWYYSIPVVIIPILLIAWIAQWLFWAGYVNVARDRYCPPKLASLTIVWVVFETLAAIIGACF